MSEQCCGTCVWIKRWKNGVLCNYPESQLSGLRKELPALIDLQRFQGRATDGADCPCYEPEK